MIRIKTALGDGYSVLLGRGISKNTGSLIAGEGISDVKKIMIVSDSSVYPLYGEKLKAALTKSGYTVSDFVFPAGEHSKTCPTAEKLWEKLGENSFTDKDLLIALGGGVTGDITGFAASAYLTGMRFIQMPTSLLAMTDCMIGGKNAITLRNGYNIVGTVRHPSLIITDTAFLDTLPEDIFNEGMAEAIKTAMTDSKELYDLIMQDKPDIEKIIALAAYEKKEKYESGSKDEIAKLYFGHTAADAIEAKSDLSHGKALALGMLLTTRSAAKMGICNYETEKYLINMLKKYSLISDEVFTEEDVAEYTIKQMRREGDILTMAMPKKPGESIIMKIDISHYEKYFKK